MLICGHIIFFFLSYICIMSKLTSLSNQSFLNWINGKTNQTTNMSILLKIIKIPKKKKIQLIFFSQFNRFISILNLINSKSLFEPIPQPEHWFKLNKQIYIWDIICNIPKRYINQVISWFSFDIEINSVFFFSEKISCFLVVTVHKSSGWMGGYYNISLQPHTLWVFYEIMIKELYEFFPFFEVIKNQYVLIRAQTTCTEVGWETALGTESVFKPMHYGLVKAKKPSAVLKGEL